MRNPDRAKTAAGVKKHTMKHCKRLSAVLQRDGLPAAPPQECPPAVCPLRADEQTPHCNGGPSE